MIFQKVACLGDSQTFGARSTWGYPEHLACELDCTTENTWACINLGVNEETTLQILRRADRELRLFSDVMIWTVMVGTNDCRQDVMTSQGDFAELYSQLIHRMLMEKKIVIAATIPPMAQGYAHLPYGVGCRNRRVMLNKEIRRILQHTQCYEPIEWGEEADPEHYADAVHLNDTGVTHMAKVFAEKIKAVAA